MNTAQTIALALVAMLTIAIVAPQPDCDQLTAPECERQAMIIAGAID